jgi:CBS domain containing-hemolysin-like protein
VVSALLIVLALLLTAVCGVFVAAEFSLTTVERSRVERAARDGDRRAQGVLAAIRRLTFQLSAAQLGITVTSLVIGMLAEPAVSALLRGPLRATGLSAGAADGVAVIAGLLLSTAVLMVGGELVPKNLAIARPLEVAGLVSRPLRVFAAAFSLLIEHLNRMANRVVRRLGVEPTEELASARTPQELVALARYSAREGALESDTATAFVRSLRLRELATEQVMTPRVDVRALSVEASAADVTALTGLTGLSRFPVYQDTLDLVVGVVHVKSALARPAAERGACPVTSLMSEPVLVPETLTADVLLELLRGEQSMAVVVDEYGGTAGVVTLEDVVEEIVGEIRDEYDPELTSDLVPMEPDGSGRARWRADGIARTHQLADIGLSLPHGPYETLAGYLAARLGRIPREGDDLEVDGWRLHVEQVANHIAERVEITAPAGHEPADRKNGGGSGGNGGGNGGREDGAPGRRDA